MEVRHDASSSTTKGAALFIAAMASFITPFIAASLNVALPSIGKEFSLTAIALDWTVTGYLLAAAILLVPFGRLADIKGRKRIFTIGIIVDAVASVLAIFSPSGALFIMFRVLQGIGGAMIFGIGIAIVTSVFPAAERGKALGIGAAATYTGLAFGPPIGGFLTGAFGWRGIFGLDVLLELIVIVAVFWKLKGEWAEAKGEKFDVVGFLVYGFALFAIMYGFSLVPEALGLGLIAIGVVGLGVFVFWENRTANPLLDIRLFRQSAAFAMSNLAALVNYCATFAVGFLLSLYLQYIKGFGPEAAGLVLVSQPVIMAALSPVAGRLSDRIQPRLLASVGMALTTVGLTMLIFLSRATDISFVLGALVILGLGFGLFSSPNTNAVMTSVDKRFYGVASGTLGTMRLIGQMLSLGTVMIMFALHIGKAQITPEYYDAFLLSARLAFIVFAVLCFGGIFASLARGKSR
jgi:EmrB/QacA subfamily drug resistance transporter